MLSMAMLCKPRVANTPHIICVLKGTQYMHTNLKRIRWKTTINEVWENYHCDNKEAAKRNDKNDRYVDDWYT